MTVELQRRILQHLAQGKTINVACAAEGIGRSTFNRATRDDPAFKAAALRARGQGMVRIENDVLEALMAEAAQGNVTNLLRYFLYRHGKFEAELDEMARREEEEERKESSGGSYDEVLGVIIAAVQRQLGQQQPAAAGGDGGDPGPAEPLPAHPAHAGPG
jgi:hypothetical protein